MLCTFVDFSGPPSTPTVGVTGLGATLCPMPHLLLEHSSTCPYSWPWCTCCLGTVFLAVEEEPGGHRPCEVLPVKSSQCPHTVFRPHQHSALPFSARLACQVSRTAEAKFHTQCLRTPGTHSHRSRGWKQEVKVVAGVGSPEALSDNLLHASPLASEGLLATFGVPWLVETSPRFLPVYVSVSKCPFFIRDSHCGLVFILMTSS